MKTNILVTGRHPKILEILLKHINNNENWTATGTIQQDEAVKLLMENKYDLLLLSSGLETTEVEELTQNATETKVVQHFGGGTGLLFNEIHYALSKDM